MAFRVALLGIYHESNTFIGTPTTVDDFRSGHWLVGEEIRTEYRDAHHEIGGMLEVLDKEGVEVVLVMFAEATPGGVITAETYRTLLDGLLNRLERILPVDGCLVVPHGAAVSEKEPDMDGHWLGEVRARVGKGIPVIGTLDLHANVSPLMVEMTDALVTYKRNPHVDQRERGKEAAQLLVDCLKGKTKPVQRLVQTPIAISIEQQYTEQEPCRSLYALADGWGKQEGILAVSIALGFPYADVEEMGTSVLVVADGDERKAWEAANGIALYLIENRSVFIGEKITIETALDMALNQPKPILMLDMGDNIGGGSPGNGLALLNGLAHRGDLKYFICLYDPQGVEQVEASLAADVFDLTLHGYDADGATKKVLTVKPMLVADGKFREDDPRHGGQVNFDMGKMAVVHTSKGDALMLMSRRIPPFSLRQLTAFDIQPQAFDIIIAKGVNAPIAAYGPVCPTVVQVDTPGVTQTDMTKFDYKNRRRPLFPFESDNVIWSNNLNETL